MIANAGHFGGTGLAAFMSATVGLLWGDGPGVQCARVCVSRYSERLPNLFQGCLAPSIRAVGVAERRLLGKIARDVVGTRHDAGVS